ncbi:MAG: hypothetical protein WBA74_09055 [Cyclobacteriaceae bacterium]
MISKDDLMPKRLILGSLTLMSVFLMYSCEQEAVSPATNLETQIEDSPAGAGSWSDIFWEGFDNSNLGQWYVTNRDDYNSSKCNYRSGQVRSGISVEGKKVLRITAKEIDFNNNEFISGHIKSKGNWRPGWNKEIRFEANFKFKTRNWNNSTYNGIEGTNGAWPAFWTVNETNWPKGGELDMIEVYSKSGSVEGGSNVFFGWNTGQNIINGQEKKWLSWDQTKWWSTYAMAWRNLRGANTATMYLNGDWKASYNNSQYLNNFSNHNIILNYNVGGTGAAAGIFPNKNFDLKKESYMYVDWVKVRQRNIW